MFHVFKRIASALLVTSLLSSTALADPSVEVLHFWTSGGEAQAIAVLKDDVTSKGVRWQDSPVAGGGGAAAKTVLQARMMAGDPPTAMLMLGQDIIEWAREGMLTEMNAVATADQWDAVLPAPVQAFTKVDGNYVSAPTNIHRINMVWANKAAFDKIGAKPPKSWAEFNALAERFRSVGIIPLAHGGQPWQEMTLFDSVVLGIGGPDFYRKAFIDLDRETLGSDTMKAVFTQMRVLRNMVDDGYPGRDWNLAASMVIRGEAAMQIMGDWSKGEFTTAGQTAGQEFLCFSTPSDQPSFIYLINSLSMFKQTSEDRQQGQTILARAILDPTNQIKFNMAKGSIPARTDVNMDGFDDCAQQTMRDLQQATASNTALPSFAFTHAASASAVGAVTDVVTEHFNSDMSSDHATERLIQALDLM